MCLLYMCTESDCVIIKSHFSVFTESEIHNIMDFGPFLYFYGTLIFSESEGHKIFCGLSLLVRIKLAWNMLVLLLDTLLHHTMLAQYSLITVMCI